MKNNQKRSKGAPMDTDEMPTLISDSDDDDMKGTKKKWLFSKKATVTSAIFRVRMYPHK